MPPNPAAPPVGTQYLPGDHRDCSTAGGVCLMDHAVPVPSVPSPPPVDVIAQWLLDQVAADEADAAVMRTFTRSSVLPPQVHEDVVDRLSARTRAVRDIAQTALDAGGDPDTLWWVLRSLAAPYNHRAGYDLAWRV